MGSEASLVEEQGEVFRARAAVRGLPSSWPPGHSPRPAPRHDPSLWLAHVAVKDAQKDEREPGKGASDVVQTQKTSDSEPGCSDPHPEKCTLRKVVQRGRNTRACV